MTTTLSKLKSGDWFRFLPKQKIVYVGYPRKNGFFETEIDSNVNYWVVDEIDGNEIKPIISDGDTDPHRCMRVYTTNTGVPKNFKPFDYKVEFLKHSSFQEKP